MKKQVKCPCGTVLSMSCDSPSKKVRCPKCHRILKLSVDQPQRDQPQRPVTCPCGARVRIRSTVAGKKVRCPRCDAIIPSKKRAAKSGSPASSNTFGVRDQAASAELQGDWFEGSDAAHKPRRKGNATGDAYRFSLTGKEILMIVATSLFGLLMLACDFIQPSLKSIQRGQLHQVGERTEGRLLRKKIIRSRRGFTVSSYNFWLDYTPKSGLTRFERQFRFDDSGFYERYSVGQQVPVLYHPDDADVSKLEGAGLSTPLPGAVAAVFLWVTCGGYVHLRYRNEMGAKQR
ncbi:MAG: DUF3592 domain-containing protein [Fuerstiella sp.]